MAITGTGTSESPYVVETWEEFLSVATSTSVYIKCADNCVWDFNRIAPEGIQNINISFADWDGNGVQLKNISYINQTDRNAFGLKFILSTSAPCNMKNVNIINCYVNSYYTSDSTAFLYISGRLHATNCTISAYVNSGVFLTDRFTGTSSSSNETMFNVCSFTVKLQNSSVFFSAANTNRKIQMMNCKIDFECSDTANIGNYNYPLMFWTNCKITGKLPTSGSWNIQGSTLVVDAYSINSQGASSLRLSGGSSTTTVNVLFNSSKFPTNYSFPGAFKVASTTQMTDISYLQSIGFPVVEV